MFITFWTAIKGYSNVSCNTVFKKHLEYGSFVSFVASIGLAIGIFRIDGSTGFITQKA
jgi:hypothetical protein